MAEPIMYNHSWECNICGFQIGTISNETIHMFAEMDKHASNHAMNISWEDTDNG